ncbi:hypothetical protein HDU96_005421 [Phlyctochytrium bullatum]|nr:hypothetical protein HDU96_005421 [Phlyctochytrium bullatum]
MPSPPSSKSWNPWTPVGTPSASPSAATDPSGKQDKVTSAPLAEPVARPSSTTRSASQAEKAQPDATLSSRSPKPKPSTVPAPSKLQAEPEAKKKKNKGKKSDGSKAKKAPQPTGGDKNEDGGEVFIGSAGPLRLTGVPPLTAERFGIEGIEEIFDEKEGLLYEEEDETDQSNDEPDEEMDDLKRIFFGGRSWAMGLTRQAQFEWLVDCFRLHATQHKTGVYEKKSGDPEEFAKALANDFFKFCGLATVVGVVPWYGANIWSKFLVVARRLLPEPLDKVAAWEKHQSEAFFSGKTRYGRSLPFTAQLVYEIHPDHWVYTREEPPTGNRGKTKSAKKDLRQNFDEEIKPSVIDHPVELFKRVEITAMMYRCGQIGLCGLCGKCNLCKNAFFEFGGARMWKQFKLDLVADITGCPVEENVSTYVGKYRSKGNVKK